MGRPRMLLLEDDAAVRRFVELTLDGLELELLPCATLAQAYETLAHTPVQLVLTDLTLPDGSGLELLQWLQARAMACRTLVFSGATDAALQQKLQACGVWRVLLKPASVGSLVDCVGAALADLAPAAQAPAALAVDPVAQYFGGNQALYAAYRQSCMGPLAQDVAAGDHAVQEGDWEALRRVAHNLKSALALLGQEQAALVARATEEHAAQRAVVQAHAGWEQLRLQVRALVEQDGPG